MRNISQEIDDLLVQYLEGKLTGEKLDKMKTGLATSEELQSRLEVLKLIQSTLQNEPLVKPSSNFTQRVMDNLHRAPATGVVTPKNGLLLLCGILVAIGIGAVMVDAGFFNSINGMLTINQFELPSGLKTPSIPSIPLSGKIIINGIIALNLGLAFLILDRTILRPYFRNRRIQF